MQTTLNTFEERKSEIDLYFDTLEQLYDRKMEETPDNPFFFKTDFLIILKSNALLMLYNLIESTIMGGLNEIYAKLKDQNVCYTKVSKEIQNIWFSSMFNQVYDKNAHYHSYRDKAGEIVDSILNNDVLLLDRNAVHISGNLDAEQIRLICREHGIKFVPCTKCKGGKDLETIKEKRNYLAHGNESFVECGRNITISELKEKKERTYLYLRDVLDGFSEYYEHEGYLAS